MDSWQEVWWKLSVQVEGNFEVQKLTYLKLLTTDRNSCFLKVTPFLVNINFVINARHACAYID